MAAATTNGFLYISACVGKTEKGNFFGKRGFSAADYGIIKQRGLRVQGIVNSSDGVLRKSKEMKVIETTDEAIFNAFQCARFVEGKHIFRQTFAIRAYEVGPDKFVSLATLMNFLMEVNVNHMKSITQIRDSSAVTHEMSIRKLIWVVTRINIQIEKYISWGDIIEIDSYIAEYRKNGARRDWIIRDYTTKHIIARATSTWVLMNQETRRLSKFPEQIKEELKSYFVDQDKTINAITDDMKKHDELNDEVTKHIKQGLVARWSDMDSNQHVNHVKYIEWILESMPIDIMKDYNLTNITLEFLRECHHSDVLESLVSIKDNEGGKGESDHAASNTSDLETMHQLRKQQGNAEIVRARGKWTHI